jgi:hypothetical protein
MNKKEFDSIGPEEQKEIKMNRINAKPPKAELDDSKPKFSMSAIASKMSELGGHLRKKST